MISGAIPQIDHAQISSPTCTIPHKVKVVTIPMGIISNYALQFALHEINWQEVVMVVVVVLVVMWTNETT